MAETLEIPLKDLREWLERETVQIVEPLKTEGKRFLNDVKDKLDDVLEACDKLSEGAEREITKGSRKTYRRAKVLAKLARSFSEMIDKVTVPDEVSRENLHVLCEGLGKTLDTIGRERWKWFPVISPYFIIDRRRFDIALKRAMDSFKEMRSFSSDEYAKKAKTVEDAFSMIDKLLQTLGELDETKKQMKKTELGKGFLEKKIAENQRKITSIQSKSEVIELDQINQRIEELEKKVKHNLRYLQKPFIKFQSLARGTSYSLPLDEAKKLSEYLSNPLEAFVTEPEGYPTLKSILRRMEDVITQGKLKLKGSRLRKAKDQIDSVLKDSLVSLHQSCKETFSQRQQLSASGIITETSSELTQLQQDLKDLQKQKELVDSRSAVLKEKIETTVKKIEEQKKGLEKAVLELTGKNVQVVL